MFLRYSLLSIVVAGSMLLLLSFDESIVTTLSSFLTDAIWLFQVIYVDWSMQDAKAMEYATPCEQYMYMKE